VMVSVTLLRKAICRMSTDLGSFVGLGEGPTGGGQAGNSNAGSLAPSPFKLPASYEEAKERKVAAVSDLRNAVKAVGLAQQRLLTTVPSWPCACCLLTTFSSL
jgi:hypothetical protein